MKRNKILNNNNGNKYEMSILLSMIMEILMKILQLKWNNGDNENINEESVIRRRKKKK